MAVGGCLPRRGVCPGGVCLPRRGVSAQGVCVCLPACSEAEPPPPPRTEFLTHVCENIPLRTAKIPTLAYDLLWKKQQHEFSWTLLNLIVSHPPPAPHPDNGRSVIKGAFTILLLDNHRRGILQLVSLPFSMEEKRHWLRSLKMFYRQHLFLRLSWKDEASSFQQEILSVNQWSFCTEG